MIEENKKENVEGISRELKVIYRAIAWNEVVRVWTIQRLFGKIVHFSPYVIEQAELKN